MYVLIKKICIQTLPDLGYFKFGNFRFTRIIKDIKIEITTFSKALNIYFFTGTVAQRVEVGGRILLGDHTVGGAVTLRQIAFRRAGVWISTGLPFLSTPIQCRG